MAYERKLPSADQLRSLAGRATFPATRRNLLDLAQSLGFPEIVRGFLVLFPADERFRSRTDLMGRLDKLELLTGQRHAVPAAFPSPGELKVLAACSRPYCLTLYIPTPNLAEAAHADTTRTALKHLVRQADAALQSTDIAECELRKTLQPARNLSRDDAFWLHNHEGLALFMHAQFFRYYTFSEHDLAPLLTVGRGFNLVPLLSSMREDQSYVVLAFGGKSTQSYAVDYLRSPSVTLKESRSK